MQQNSLMFRSYSISDCEECLALFDQNCPTFFAENERADFKEYLVTAGGQYQVGTMDNELVAAFGFSFQPKLRRAQVSWIMVSPLAHGKGIGSKMMNRALELAKDCQAACVDIAASHLSAPFFAKFGATEVKVTPDGWGPGMHRIDMELLLESPYVGE